MTKKKKKKMMLETNHWIGRQLKQVKTDASTPVASPNPTLPAESQRGTFTQKQMLRKNNDMLSYFSTSLTKDAG